MEGEVQVQDPNKVEESTGEATGAQDTSQSETPAIEPQGSLEGTPNSEEVVANTRIGKVQEYRNRIAEGIKAIGTGSKATMKTIIHRADADVEILASLAEAVDTFARMLTQGAEYAENTTTKDAYARARFRTSANYADYVNALVTATKLGATIPGFKAEERELSPEMFESFYNEHCKDPNKGKDELVPLRMKFAVNASFISGEASQAAGTTRRVQAPTAPAGTPATGGTLPEGWNRQKAPVVDRKTGEVHAVKYNGLWKVYKAESGEVPENVTNNNMYAVMKTDWGKESELGMRKVEEWAATQQHEGKPRFALVNKDAGNAELEELSGFVNGKPVYTAC